MGSYGVRGCWGFMGCYGVMWGDVGYGVIWDMGLRGDVG